MTSGGALIASVSLPENLLDDSNLTESQRVIVALIRDSGKKMLEIVDSSMTLYRIEEGTYINDPKKSLPSRYVEVNSKPTGSRNDYCSIAIRNYGEVPQSIRDTFFNKMVTSGKKYGAGLGIYAAMLMAKAQGGGIELDCSEPGATTIYVSLPKPPEP